MFKASSTIFSAVLVLACAETQAFARADEKTRPFAQEKAQAHQGQEVSNTKVVSGGRDDNRSRMVVRSDAEMQAARSNRTTIGQEGMNQGSSSTVSESAAGAARGEGLSHGPAVEKREGNMGVTR